MAKPKRPTKAKKPVLPPICFTIAPCDSVLVGEDLTPTVVRMLDTIGVPPEASRKTGDKLEVRGVTLFIGIRRGESAESGRLLVESINPLQKRSRVGELDYFGLKEPQRGIHTRAPLLVSWGGEGVYWYEVITADGTVIGRCPFRIIVGTSEEVQKILQADIDEVRKDAKPK